MIKIDQLHKERLNDFFEYLTVHLSENGIRKQAFLCKSKYIDRFTPYPDDKQLDMAYHKDYLVNEPKYSL